MPFFEAVINGRAERVCELLHEGELVDQISQEYHTTALYQAAYHQQLKVARALLAHHADPNIGDEFGVTPLHLAAETNEYMVELILDHRADPNAETVSGKTPIFNAQKDDRLGIIIQLLNRGANVYHLSKEGRSILYRAARDDQLTIVKYLTKHYPENINYRRKANGYTALFESVRSASIELVETLLKHGADPEIPDDDGTTPLHMAAKYARPQIVKLLLKYGANANRTNATGYTPLGIALVNNHRQTTSVIVEHLIENQQWIFDPILYARLPLELRIRVGVLAQLWSLQSDESEGNHLKLLPIELLHVLLKQLMTEYTSSYGG